MWKKACKFGWSIRKQFLKYALVGTSGLFLDISSLIILTEVVGWSPVFSVVVNQLIVFCYNFTLNKYWSFKCKKIPHKQLVRYFILWALNYPIAILSMYVFHSIFDFDYKLVRIVTAGVSVWWNFFLCKYWVYK